MSTFAPARADTAPPDPSKHVRYTLGMVLGVDDFDQEFAFLSGRDKRIVRDVVGYGVVSGLAIDVVPGDDGRPEVQVAPGEAIVPSGQLVCVSPTQCASIEQWLNTHRADLPPGIGGSPPEDAELVVVLCHRECPVDDVPIPGEPCRSAEDLMAASRLQDWFELQLRLPAEAPPQREEDAVRAFVAWLRDIPLLDGAEDVEGFVHELRLAAGLDATTSPPTSPPASPPASPPGAGPLFDPPPPGLSIPPAFARDYVAAAFDLWVRELRAHFSTALPGAERGCGGPPPGEPDDCLALADLTVPVTFDPTLNSVAVTGPVAIDTSRRPNLLHLRLLEEWMLSAAGDLMIPDSPPAMSSPPAVSSPPAAPAAPVVAAGRVDVSGNTSPAPLFAHNGLTVKALDTQNFLVTFPGWDASAVQVVTGTPVTSMAEAQVQTVELIPDDDPDLPGGLDPGAVVRVRKADGGDPTAGFTVRIEQFEAGP